MHQSRKVPLLPLDRFLGHRAAFQGTENLRSIHCDVPLYGAAYAASGLLHESYAP